MVAPGEFVALRMWRPGFINFRAASRASCVLRAKRLYAPGGV